MTRDPRVDLVFSHNLARYVATGVDPNDAQRLIVLIERWEDWCRLWSEEAARHEALAEEAADKGRALTAAEAYVRAAIYYHYGKQTCSSFMPASSASSWSVLSFSCRVGSVAAGGYSGGGEWGRRRHERHAPAR